MKTCRGTTDVDVYCFNHKHDYFCIEKLQKDHNIFKNTEKVYKVKYVEF